MSDDSSKTISLKEVSMGDTDTLLEALKKALSDLTESVANDDVTKYQTIGKLSFKIIKNDRC